MLDRCTVEQIRLAAKKGLTTVDDEPQRSEELRERSRFMIVVKLDGPVIIKVTGPALALVLVLALLVLTWYLSR